MKISVDDLARNADKYVKMAQDEDIVIIKDGRAAAKLVASDNPKMAAVRRLKGILPSDIDVEALRLERILR